MKLLLVAINAKFIHSNPAVHLLRAYAGELKNSIAIKEYTINQRKAEILADLYETTPDVLAFSCYIWNRELLFAVLKELPKILPEVPIFLGGPEVSYHAPEILRETPAVTGIMIGEGEETFRELASFYLKAENTPTALSEIAGLCLRKNRDTKAHGNPAPFEADPRTDVSKPAFPGSNVPLETSTAVSVPDATFFTAERALLPMDRIPFIYEEYRDTPDLGPFKNKILYYETSRGCPFRCSYCLSSVDKSLRLRSLDRVFPELQFFLDRKVPQVKFIDRTFNCNHSHALSIWRYLKEHDNGVTNFHFEIAGDLLSAEELSLLSSLRPGLVQLEIGVQSTNSETLKEICRVTDMDRLRENVARLRAGNNIHLHLDLIAGLPYEDLESFIQSFNALYEMSPDALQLGFLKVLHGTLMEEKAEAYELKTLSDPPYEVLSTHWLSYADILRLKKVEELLEIYHNSGQFTKTLDFLVPRFPSPFALFEALAKFAEQENFSLQSPARSSRYEFLLKFSQKAFPENEALLRELLTYDLYLRENMKSRPAFCRDLAPFHEELSAKEKKKTDHIEVFDYPLWISAADGETPSEKPCFVRFDYEDRDPLNHNARIEVLH